MADRDKYLYMAKLAEQAEKYDGMRICIDKGYAESCFVLKNSPAS